MFIIFHEQQGTLACRKAILQNGRKCADMLIQCSVVERFFHDSLAFLVHCSQGEICGTRRRETTEMRNQVLRINAVRN
jgi:hypothetical protein